MDEPTLPSEVPPTSGSAMTRGVLIVTGVLVVVFPVVAGYGYWAHGEIGVMAAALAAGVSWLGGVAGLLVSLPFQGLQAVNGVLLGMLVRMTVPLAAAAGLFLRGGELVRAGLVEMLVVNYLIALALDTVLSVRMVRRIAAREAKA